MSGHAYRAARLRVAGVVGAMLVFAPSLPPLPALPSFVTIDWSDAAPSIHMPHLSVRIAVEVTP